jgi:hypothetical protein
MLIATKGVWLECGFLDCWPIAVTYKRWLGRHAFANLRRGGKSRKKQLNFAGIKDRKNEAAFE